MQHCITFSKRLLLSVFFGLLTCAICQAQVPVLKEVAKKKPEQQQHLSTSEPLSQQVSPSTAETAIDRAPIPSKRSPKPPPLPPVAQWISSRSVMVMEASTGRVLFSKSPDTRRQPASTIKILTGMLALTYLEKDDVMSVSPKAAAMPSSKAYLDPARQYSADEMINAVLLASANDASVVLAENIAGSELEFAKIMTLHAKLWGARNTVCKTASGLTASGQYSTARDLANIFRKLMRDQEFARRMKLRKVETSFGRVLYNHNKALWRIKGTDAGKTGYTAKARQTYVGQFTREGETIIVAVLGSETMWGDVKRLVDYGFRKLAHLHYAEENID